MGASLPCNNEDPDVDVTRSPPPLLPGAASLSPPPFLAVGASFGTPGEFRPAQNIDGQTADAYWMNQRPDGEHAAPANDEPGRRAIILDLEAVRGRHDREGSHAVDDDAATTTEDDNRAAGAGVTGEDEEGEGVEESSTGRLVRLISEKAARAEAKSALLVERVEELELKLEEARSWKAAVEQAAGEVVSAAARQQRHGGEAKKQKSGNPTKGNI